MRTFAVRRNTTTASCALFHYVLPLQNSFLSNTERKEERKEGRKIASIVLGR